MIYVLSGEGYSDVRGQAQHWEAGDVLHVPPAMFEHEHYNDSPHPLRYLRSEFGIPRSAWGSTAAATAASSR